MGREQLPKVVSLQVAGTVVSGQLLRAHHTGFDQSSQEHDEGDHDVHDADFFVIDTGQPVAPERPPTSASQ